MHLRLGISPPSRCKYSKKMANESNFRKKFAKKVAELTKKLYDMSKNTSRNVVEDEITARSW